MTLGICRTLNALLRIAPSAPWMRSRLSHMHVGTNFRMPGSFQPVSMKRPGSSTQVHSVGRCTAQALFTAIVTMPRLLSAERSICVSDGPDRIRNAERPR